MMQKRSLIFLLLLITITCLSAAVAAFQQQYTVDDAPDELSEVSNEIQCHRALREIPRHLERS
jgi:hypothetical protein